MPFISVEGRSPECIIGEGLNRAHYKGYLVASLINFIIGYIYQPLAPFVIVEHLVDGGLPIRRFFQHFFTAILGNQHQGDDKAYNYLPHDFHIMIMKYFLE